MRYLKDIFYLFYPEICVSCKKHCTNNKEIVCISCRHDLPLTHFCNEKGNTVEKLFYGRVVIQNATAYLYYRKKGKTQKIIYALKYQNKQKIGTLFGTWIGKEIKESQQFKELDCIIPVPLHTKKQKKRGYNQLTYFGKQLSTELKIPYLENILLRTTNNISQKKKKRLERWENVASVFTLKNTSQLKNKHILLIDDVITTGATLETCVLLLQKTEGVTISIATMAYTE